MQKPEYFFNMNERRTAISSNNSLISPRKDIDGLRAIAVLSVVLFHAGVPGASGGYVGVDVFFAISGFLITSSVLRRQESGNFSALDFFDRRARRLGGAFMIVVVATWALAFALMLPADYKAFVDSITYSVVFAANQYFYGQIGYFDTAHITKPLLHLWSLAIEEQFYVAIAFIFFWAALRRHAMALLTLIVVLSFFASIIAVSRDSDKAFFLLPFRAWELGAGVLLAFYIQAGKNIGNARWSNSAGLIALLVLLLCIFLYRDSFYFPGATALPPIVATVIIILTGINPSSTASRLLSYPALTFIGRKSYGIYLIHWPLIVMATYYLDRPLGITETGAVLILTLALAELSWRVVERPIEMRSDRFFRCETLAVTLLLLFLFFLTSCIPFASRSLSALTNAKAVELASGRADWTHDQFDCADKPAETMLSGNFCRFGKVGGRKILLWGDSHASAILPILQEIASNKSLELHILTSNGCPPLLSLETDKPGCLTANDAVARIVRSGGYASIIVAANWQSYGNSNNIRLGKDSLGRDAPELTKALERTLSRISKSGARAIVVGQVPVYVADVPTSLAKAVYYRTLDAVLGYERKLPAHHHDTPYLDKAIQARSPIFVRPSEHMCTEFGCKLIEDGKSLYKDRSHLSPFGSRILYEPLFSALTQ